MATIRGLTIEIGATTTKLGTELKKIKYQSSEISGELRTVDKLLKFENGDKTELLKRRLEAVEKAASEVKKEMDLYTKGLDANKKAVDAGEISQEQYEKNIESLNKQLNTAKNRYEVLQAELGDTARKLDESKKGTDENAEALQEMGDAADDAGKKSLSLGDLIKGNLISGAILGGLKSLGSLIGSVAKAAFEGIKKIVSSGLDLVFSTGEWADALLEQSEVTRLSTVKLQEYDYALNFIDGDLDTVTAAMKRNIRSMGDARDGAGEVADAYSRLGVQVYDVATGQLRDSEIVFWEIIDALGRIPNETERDEIAMTLLGKSATDLNPIINAGSDAFIKLREEAQRLGIVMSEDDVEAMGLFQDEVDKFNLKLDSLKRQIGLELMPVVNDIITRANEFFASPEGKKLLDDLTDGIGNVSKSIVEFLNSEDFKNFKNEQLPKIEKFVSDLIANLPEIAKTIKEKTPGIVADLEKVLGAVAGIVDFFNMWKISEQEAFETNNWYAQRIYNHNNQATGRASGGSVLANSLYRVGEKGPELFVPRVNGTILNAQQTQALTTQPQQQAAPTQTEQIINLTVPQTVYLDGEVIYKNQLKIQRRKGSSLIAGGLA